MPTLLWRRQETQEGDKTPPGYILSDGEREYARVLPVESRNHKRVVGWYWIVQRSAVGEYMNTCARPTESIEDAMRQAMDFIIARLPGDCNER